MNDVERVRSLRGAQTRAVPLRQRFEAKIERIPGVDCWIWFGSASVDGYGRFRGAGKVENATYTSLRLFRGEEVPIGKIVLHKCDTPACVRPDHLVIGTHKENSEDRGKKGRHARGDRSGKARLSAEDVRLIRSCKDRNIDLARRFGINESTVSNIRKRRHWKWLEG